MIDPALITSLFYEKPELKDPKSLQGGRVCWEISSPNKLRSELTGPLSAGAERETTLDVSRPEILKCNLMQRLNKWHHGCFCKDSLNWRRVGAPTFSVCKLSGCCGDCHFADVHSARSVWSGVVILHTSPYMSPSWSIAFSPTGAYHRDENTSL